MRFPIDLIEENSLKVLDDSFEIKTRLIWYRSLPLLYVEDVRLSINDHQIDLMDIQLGINDQTGDIFPVESDN